MYNLLKIFIKDKSESEYDYSHDGIKAYVLKNSPNGAINILVLAEPINYTFITTQVLLDSRVFFKDRFSSLFPGSTIDFLYLVFIKEPSLAFQLNATDLAFWAFDDSNKHLIVFQKQPTDFMHLREAVTFLSNYKIDGFFTSETETFSENVASYSDKAPNSDRTDNSYKMDSSDKTETSYRMDSSHKTETSYRMDSSYRSPNSYRKFTAFIVIINVLAFFYLDFKGNTLDSDFMLDNGAAYWKFIFEDNQYYRLFTSTFMHFGFDHLINNMVTLAVIGSFVEKEIGCFSTAFVYLFGGLLASITSALYHSSQGALAVSAGASGAIFALIGAMLVIMIFDRSSNAGYNNLKRAFIIIGLMIFTGLFNEELDNAAHIGGFISGVLLSILPVIIKIRISKSRQNERSI